MSSFCFTGFTSKNVNMLNPTAVQMLFVPKYKWKKFHMKILYNQSSAFRAHESFQF